jgi:hypothetical protein
MISVELVNCARRERKDVPAKEIISCVSDVFTEQKADNKLRSEITMGFVHVVAGIETCEEWMQLEGVFGKTLDDVFNHWVTTMKRLQEYRDEHISRGAASVADIWCYMADLFAREVAQAQTGGEGQKPQSKLREKVLANCIPVIEIVGAYYGTRGADDRFVERVKDQFGKLTKVTDPSLREPLNVIAQNAERVMSTALNDVAKHHLSEIVAILKSRLHIHAGGATEEGQGKAGKSDGDDQHEEGGTKHPRK